MKAAVLAQRPAKVNAPNLAFARAFTIVRPLFPILSMPAKPDQNPIKTRSKPITIGLHPVFIPFGFGLAMEEAQWKFWGLVSPE
jgi:hypothetical protein